MEYAFRNTIIRVLLVITTLALIANMAWAQAGAGELSGIVTDPQGAVVSNVTVTLSNSATGSKRTTVTNSGGLYRFAALPIVGTYTLELVPSGFRGVKVDNIIVTVATVTNRDVKLEVGTSNEQVTVEANAQQVQTSESSISQLVDRRVWEQMPLETRSQNEFINMVAGAVPQIFDNTFRGAAVNGTRTGTGNYMVEGVDNNEQGQGGVTIGAGQGGANTSISPDAIQEYRVITHDFNAEYGKAGGFVTDTVLKSGTNQWHGSAFEYNRVQALAANDFFSNRAGIQDSLVRNQFGGSVGGAIIKDKTFFFSSVEFHRKRQSQPLTGVSYTQQFYDFVNTGAFEQFMESDAGGFCQQNFGAACPGGFSQSSTVGPIFKDQESKFPNAVPIVNSNISTADCAAGNIACAGQGVYTGQSVFGIGALIQYPVPLYDSVTESDNQPLNQYRVSLKIDHKLSDKDQINGVYLLEDAKAEDSLGGGDATFGVPFVNPNRAQTIGLTWTHTFSPNVLNQAKAGYTRRLANFTVPGTDGIPSMITIDSLSGGFGGSQGLPQFFTENEFQYKDDLSITKGHHSFKFGGEYRRTRNGSTFDNDKNGHFWSWGGEDLITDSVFSDEADQLAFGGPYYGTWYSAGAAVNPTDGTLPDFYRGYRANEFGVYGQDDWRVKPRFTINLGLRWEYFGPPHNFKDGLDSNFYFGPATTPVATTSTNPYFPLNDPLYAKEATGAFQQRNSDIWAKDFNNFGPRIGFSWDLFGTQKVVLRSGFGMFYDRIYNNLFENIRFNPPGFCDCIAGVLFSGAPAGALATPGLLSVPFTANSSFVDPALFPAGLPKSTPRHMDENLVSPYYEQWSFGLQYDLGRNLILETNYIGTAGRKLIGIRNINTFDGRTVAGLGSTRINTTIGSDNFRNNDYGSNYHALEASLRKQFSSGLTFNFNYTFSKALDDISDAFRAKGTTSVTDPQNIHADYGPADFDLRHRFVASFNYDLPFMKGNRFLGGWSVNGIFSANSGAATALLDSGGDWNRNGVLGERPLLLSSVSEAYLGKNPADGYLNPASFDVVSCTANNGDWCDSPLGRGTFHGPTYVNLDFGVGKSFKITEGSKITLQGNAFDIFNHPNFENPQGDIESPNFGKSESTFGDNGGHRILQLAIRFDF